jgi:predicted unusual protein kinase regulating ubiquinone biosynthesis (AarF/ABC1/UbiB family)
MPNRPHDSLQQLLAEFAASEQTLPRGRLPRLGRLAAAGARIALAGGIGSSFDVVSAVGLARTLGSLKGLPMKVGQMLSYVDDSLPAEARAVLATLRTQAPPTPFPEVAACIRAELGERAEVLLAGLDPKPIATASIGQVHRGRLPDGSDVAVKVRHPGIEQALRADLAQAAIGRQVARLMAPSANVTAVAAELEARLLEECNYALEAERQAEFAGWFERDPVIIVPRVFTKWCGPGVLVSEFIQGESWDELLSRGPAQEERDAIGRALYRFFIGTLYGRGVLAADPHPGNFIFLPGGRVAVLDYGSVRRFERSTVASLRVLSEAVRTDDSALIRELLVELGGRLSDSRPNDAVEAEGFARGFLAPVIEPGARVMRAATTLAARDLLRNKRAMLRLNLPPAQLLFLLRIRFGLYAVLEQLAARCDWSALEAELASLGPARTQRGAGPRPSSASTP